MSQVFGLENIRIKVSSNLTRILMLFGRLQPDYNVRYLPATVSSIQDLVGEMEQLEKKYYGFSEILKENIERRDKYSKLIQIPCHLRANPGTKGMRQSLYLLTCPLIKSYCEKEKSFLISSVDISDQTRLRLLDRARQHCELLFAWCYPEDSIHLLELKDWCSEEIRKCVPAEAQAAR
jgi:hypothetical protein